MTTLRPGLARIRNLVLTQRSLRLLARAAWLGLSGFLIAWGLNALYGWFPDSRAWTLAGIAFAAPAFLAAFRPLPLDRLAWRMDRLLGLREQVTTALSVETGPAASPHGPVTGALLTDVAGRFPDLRRRIAGRGWDLARDLEALAVVLLLLATVIGSHRAGTQFRTPDAETTPLTALGTAPGFEDVFPSGIPGLSQGAPDGAGGNPGAPGPGEAAAGDLDNILSDLGEALSEHPETADIGEALQNGDLDGAAAAIERTADNVDLLPDDARQNMQEAFREAAEEARAAGQDDLADDLESAAQALENVDPDDPLAADALDELAEGLRDLGEVFGSMGQPGDQSGEGMEDGPDVGSSAGETGSGSGAGTQGLAEPLSRLEGLGEDFSIEGGDDPSGLLQPASSAGTPATAMGEATSSSGGAGPGDTGPINSVLTPYSFPWNWRDVVSDYFSP
ncbi:MAG TPA: hypothetical protein VMN57_02635 [Anaerolineales bacterium]|nr:hypothetical protein [Anaerolineales bacterium]